MFEFHEIANWLPMMDGSDLQKLADDIRDHGQRLPIVLYDGKILDGRNRYRACEIAGVEPRYETLPASTDPVAFVASMNDVRRHLTISQRAMFGDKARGYYEAEAKKRQGARTDIVETFPQSSKSSARDQAGRAVGVSGRTMDKAKKVRTDGIPELNNLVDAGKLDVTKAAKIAALPKETQETIVEDATRNNWSGTQMIQEATRLAAQKGEGDTVNATKGCPHPIRMGLQYARMAIAQLEKIAKRDKERTQALDMVQEWITENR